MIPENFVLSWEDFWKKVKECPQEKIERLQHNTWYKRVADIRNRLIKLLCITKSNNGNYCGFYDFTYCPDLLEEQIANGLVVFLHHYYCYHWLNEKEKAELEYLLSLEKNNG